MVSKSDSLTDEHAVVTGASRGIGFATVRALAALGARITLVAREPSDLTARREELEMEFSGEYYTCAADLTAPEALTAAFADSTKALGAPSILVNNVGGVESAPFIKMDLEMWRRMIDLNLTTAFLATKEVLPAMLEAGHGRIVNVASTAGVMGYPYVSGYCAAKHGMMGLTRSLAPEMAGTGVTVNAVCPGYTDTDLIRESIDRIAKTTGRDPKEIRQEFADANPGGRLIDPDEVAERIVWLCLPAQDSISGQSVMVDGTTDRSGDKG